MTSYAHLGQPWQDVSMQPLGFQQSGLLVSDHISQLENNHRTHLSTRSTVTYRFPSEDDQGTQIARWLG